MSKGYEITGKSKIKGTIKVQGCKNSALAIIVASLLAKDVVTLENVPNIKDVHELLLIIKKINGKVSFIDNGLIIDSSSLRYEPLLFEQIKNFRASYYFIGTFLSLFKKVEIYLPGGCKIGKRPIDQHIKGLSALNVDLCMKQDILKASCETIVGNEIALDIASVGATINLILASVFANNKTIIKNAAKEPEIVDFVSFLNSMGANIVGEGSNVIIVNPTNKLHSTSYHIMPDRIVAGTYMIYGAMLADKLTLTNINTKDNYTLINNLISLGVNMDIRQNQITIYKVKSFDKANIKTGTFPEFASDLQQIMTTLLFYGKGVSLIEETMFENRFSFLDEIEKLGGRFFTFENKAIIVPSSFNAGIVECKDLRGGAALLLACMMASGTSIIKNIEYIDRGYENIVEVLRSVNVDIKEIQLHEA